MAGLADFLGGLATGVGDFGKGVFDLLGTGAAAFKDLGRGISTGKFDTAEQDAFKKWLYGTNNRKDAYNKSSGTMLNGASTVADFVPGLNTLISGPIGNAAQGAIGGFADELKANGANLNWGSAGNRMLSGAAAGAATGLLGNSINKSLNKAAQTGSKNFLAKAGSNAISRGALTGALGGATAGAVSTGLNGGSLEEILGNATSSAGSGALQGAAGGGAMNVASKGLNVAKNKIDDYQTKKINAGAVDRLTDVMDNGMEGDKINFGRFSKQDRQYVDYANEIRSTMGQNPLSAREVDAYKNAVDHYKKHVGPNEYFKTNREAAEAAYSALFGGNSEILMGKPGSKGTLFATQDGKGDSWKSVAIGDAPDGSTALKNITPRKNQEIKKLRRDTQELLDSSQVGGRRYPTSASNDDSLPGMRPIDARQATNSSIPQNPQNVNGYDDFNPYGKSQLANKTKAGAIQDGLKRLGTTLEGAQTNITRAAARDLGIESPGKVVDNVRTKTGLTNLETQAQFAKELTGGADSLLDNIQRNALTASETGKPFKVDISGISEDIDSIVNEHIGRNTLGGEDAKQKFINNLKADITDGSSDVLSLSNRLKTEAADLRGKGIVDPSPKDKARAKVYTEIAHRLDDASYKAIPQENVETMFDVAIDNMRQRAKDARANGNTDIAKAYEKAADTLDNEPRTVKAFRSFKKDFVDVSKVDRLSAQAETGAAFQMGTSFAGGAKRFTNTLLQRPANAALAKIGGMINSAADSGAVDKTGSALGRIAPIDNPSSDINTALYNIAGRSIGRNETYGVDDPETVKTSYGAGLNDGMGAGAWEDLPANSSGMSGYGTQSEAGYNPPNPYTKQVDIIGNALQYALEAGDAAAYVQLLSMYNDAYQNYASVEKENNKANELSSAQQKTVLGIQNAYSSLQQLEQMYNEAGGGQGLIGGNLANFLSGIGANDAVAAYNQQSQSLINTIKDAVGKTDTANTEGEVARLMELIPKITDTKGVAQKKISNLYNELEKIYQNTLNNYSGNYALI